MSKNNIYIYFVLFSISCISVYFYFGSFSYFISYLIGGVSSSLIIFSSFYSYQKNIIEGANECKVGQSLDDKIDIESIKSNKKQKNIKTKKQNANNSLPLSSKQKTKQAKKYEKKQKKLDKQEQKIKEQYNNAGVNFKMFLFLPKILGYVFLCYGFIFLSDEGLMNIYSFLVGISILPISVFFIKLLGK
jgi:hypothetical protein